ncbi:LacI family transcriptional regulator [Chitinophagaceae bacterium LB-8]|uniref:LacI family transcriptional regulator n=1 Tax=Paraflavisolibacter caeni TaxID=2982496 RepID=A0A9X2XPV1_9BACT|nr:LacI family DNA-binding transcriptional regulator [Paraflavisolibacter caeni]MCU7552253.1 LacI family transcriptional regulator [Paraflavisolibacter caeni]
MQVKEVTIYDLAKIANVSASTVSRALKDNPSVNELTKKKIIELSGALGYRPNRFASDLRSKKTNTIGVLVSKLNRDFLTSVLSGIEQEATKAKYDVVISLSEESPEREVEQIAHLFNKRVDGLIVALSCNTNILSRFDVFSNKKMPVVFIDNVEEDGPGIKIMVDNYKAGYEAAVHLIQQGCRNLMHVAGSLNKKSYSDRWKGYQSALSKFGLRCRKDDLLVSDFSEEDCILIAQQIMQRKELPDGIFIADDLCAALFTQRFQRAGIKIPEDIALVGFNNDMVSWVVEPQLTTFNYPGFEIGAKAAETLIEEINFGTTQERYCIVMNSELLVRASTTRTKSNKIKR